MKALFFIFSTLSIILIQTIFLPGFSFFPQCFDLMIVNVLFLCLITSHYSAIFAIVLIGTLMDSLSGVPFAYHIFSYIWIYILVSVFQQLFFQKSVVFLIVMAIVSVAIEQSLLLFSILVKGDINELFTFDYSQFIPQLFWAFIIVPPSIWIIDIWYKMWQKWGRSIQRQWEKIREN